MDVLGHSGSDERGQFKVKSKLGALSSDEGPRKLVAHSQPARISGNNQDHGLQRVLEKQNLLPQ